MIKLLSTYGTDHNWLLSLLPATCNSFICPCKMGNSPADLAQVAGIGLNNYWIPMQNRLGECCFQVGSNFIVLERTGRINNMASSKPEGFDAV